MFKSRGLVLLLVTIFVGCSPQQEVKDNWTFQPTDEGGFYELNESSIPAPVRAAAHSVYHVLVPVEKAAEDVDFSFGQGTLLKLAWQLGPDDIFRKAVLSQIEACLTIPGLIDAVTHKCKISYVFSIGAGFLAGDGQTLWTAAHVINAGTRFRLAVQPAVQASYWPVYIFDEDGKMVVSPEKEFLTPARFAGYYSTKREDLSFDQAKTDYVALRLPQVVGVALKIAQHVPSPGQRVYAIGYPACTNCLLRTEQKYDSSDRAPHPNAPGGQKRLSFGKILQVVNDSVFLTSVDLTPGDSGGPSVNAAGEVVGISTQSTFWSENHITQRLGVYTRPDFASARLDMAAAK